MTTGARAAHHSLGEGGASAPLPGDDRLVRVGDLVGLVDIAERLGTTRQNVSNWYSRHEDFPLPVWHRHGKTSPVWAWPDVARWYANRRWYARSGRPRDLPENRHDHEVPTTTESDQ